MRRLTAAFLAALILTLAGATSAAGYSNGYLPESALSPIATGVKCQRPNGQLANEAAAAYNSMALAAGMKLPDNGCEAAYRPYSGQVTQRNYWCGLGECGNAAIPGTSAHG